MTFRKGSKPLVAILESWIPKLFRYMFYKLWRTRTFCPKNYWLKMHKIFIKDDFSKTFPKILYAFCTPTHFPKKLTPFSFCFSIWRCDIFATLPNTKIFSFYRSIWRWNAFAAPPNTKIFSFFSNIRRCDVLATPPKYYFYINNFDESVSTKALKH